MAIAKIISGGQTGVDRAALDVALSRKMGCGGWCPEGRHADDGPISEKYPLIETARTDHTVRTENNVKFSDGTLLFYRERFEGGTAYAKEMAEHLNKPVLVIDVSNPPDAQIFKSWINDNKIRVIHIGGQRECSSPGIYARARLLIENYLDHLAH